MILMKCVDLRMRYLLRKKRERQRSKKEMYRSEGLKLNLKTPTKFLKQVQ